MKKFREIAIFVEYCLWWVPATASYLFFFSRPSKTTQKTECGLLEKQRNHKEKLNKIYTRLKERE